QAGIVGAITATLGLILPSMLIILLVASILQQYMDLALLQHAFAGIRVAVSALVCVSVYRLGKVGIVDPLTLVWTILTFVSIAFLNISPLWVVVGSFIIGNLIGLVRKSAK